MKFSTLLKNNLSKLAKVVLSTALFSGIAFNGAIAAVKADSPQFNALAQDMPTLQVAVPGGGWTTQVTAHQGDTLNLLLWDHNSVLNTTATNVRLQIALSAAMSNPNAVGTISADNADTVSSDISVLTGGEEDNLSYVPGSAVFYNDVANSSGGYTLTPAQFPTGVDGDNIVSGGINIGSQQGCWEYAHAVQIQVRVEGGTPAIITNKSVALDGGSQNYGTSATASPADLLDFQIYLQNDGTETGTDPEIIDTLDSHLAYVPNSSYMIVKRNNVDTRVNLSDSEMNIQGNKITWGFDDMGPLPEDALYLDFQTKVAPSSQFPVGTTNFQNCATSEFSNATPVNTNCVAITVNNPATSTVSFTLLKEVSNLTLNDPEWHNADDAVAAPGNVLAYRLTLTNTGNTPAQNVVLKDLLPAGLTFDGNVELYDAANPNGEAISGDAIVNGGYTIPTVTNGSAGTEKLVFDATVNNACTSTQTLTNVGQVYYQSQLAGQSSASTIVSCSTGLIIDKEVKISGGSYSHDAGNVSPGQTLTYQITALNNGNATITNPLSFDQLPANVTYVPNTLAIDGEIQDATTQSQFFAQGIILTNFVPGMGKTITFNVTVTNNCPADLNIVNTAYAKGDNAALVSDSAKAEIVCSVPTPTPTPSNPTPTPSNPTPTPTTPGTPELPHTGGEDIFFALTSLSGAGYSSHWYLLKKRLAKASRNKHIL